MDQGQSNSEGQGADIATKKNQQIMKERSIAFGGPMVRAILEGRKTQARCLSCHHEEGDLMWVKEKYAIESCAGTGYYPPPFLFGRPLNLHVDFSGDGGGFWWEQAHYAATDPPPCLCCSDQDCRECGEDGGGEGPHWRAPLSMPRWASRIILKVTRVRIQQLLDINDHEAVAEGFGPCQGARDRFLDYWTGIHSKPDEKFPTLGAQVWVIHFERVPLQNDVIEKDKKNLSKTLNL